MQTYDERIAPGGALKITVTGSIFYVQSSSAGEVLTVEFVNGTAQGQKISGVGKGFKAEPTSRFDGVRITTTEETQVKFIISDGPVDFAFNTDEIIIGNGDEKALPVRVPAGQRLPVSIDSPIDIGDVRVNNTNAQAIPVQNQALGVIVDGVVVPIGNVRAPLVSDATLKILRIRNGDLTGTLYLGGAGITALNAAVVLAPGDMWEEQSAAGATWFAVSDGPTISVKIQGIK